jgi:hypothetical protein
MGRAHTMHGTDEKCVQNVGLKTERDQLEDLGIDGRIILQ